MSKLTTTFVGLVLMVLAMAAEGAVAQPTEEVILQRSACQIRQLLSWQPAPLIASVKDGAFTYEYGYFKDEMVYRLSRNVTVTLEWKGGGRVEEVRSGAGKVVSRQLGTIRSLSQPIRHKLSVLRPAAMACLKNIREK